MVITSDAPTFKRLKGAPRQREFLALDTEDDQLGFGSGTGYYLGCVYGPDGAHVFKQRWRLIRYLSRPKWGGYWCACHNLEYDAQNVFGPEEVALMQPCFSGSKLVGLRLQVKPGRGRGSFLHFFDTSAFLAAPLAKIAPLVGLEKFDAEHKRGVRQVTPQMKDYCVQDTRIVYEIAHWLQRGVNALGAQLNLTAASTSMDCFRRQYQAEDIPQLQPVVQDELHKGYTGGRVECFRLGDFKGRLYGNDFNGMYAAVMIDSRLPEIGSFGQRRKMNLAHEGMSHCRLEVPEHLWAGPLPLKGEKLTFPVGRLDGYWCHNELRQALNYGCRVNKVYASWASSRSESYLREMMAKLRGIRENPNTEKVVSQMAKLLMNSLYGRFASRPENFVYMTRGEFDRRTRSGTLPAYCPERTVIHEKLNLVKVVMPAEYPAYSNTIWSAIITAGARCRLYPHLDEESSYYCDTDSVLGKRRYPETKQLGALALKDRYRRLVIRGNKLYAGELSPDRWEAHAKGVPRSLALAAVMEPGRKLEHRRPVKLRSALRGDQKANAWIQVYKRLSGDYDKRTVERGGRTRPIRRFDW
jgi:hypothetical protein